MQGRLSHRTHVMGGVRLLFLFLVIGVGQSVTLNGAGSGPSKCGNINRLLTAIQDAHQSTSEQDAANRLSLLLDMKNWSQYCVQGVCKWGLSPLAEQFYEESTIFASWVPSELSSVRYGENYASAKFKLSIGDVCGGTSIVDAEFIFYCQGQWGRATQIHTLFETNSYNQLHSNLVDCVKVKEQEEVQEEPLNTIQNVLPDPVQLTRPPKFILEEEILETPSPFEE